jgi:hypothetical protein
VILTLRTAGALIVIKHRSGFPMVAQGLLRS